MPNSRRFHLAGIAQHVVQRGNNGYPCFPEPEDRAEYLSRLTAAAARFEVAIHAYVVMTNHVHLLATPDTPEGVGKCMQAAGSGYVRLFNSRHARTGTLWDGRYFSSLVGNDAYLWNCYRYIELNPVRAGLVAAPADYAWSSYRRKAHGCIDAAVRPHPAYEALSGSERGRCSAYAGIFDAGLDARVADEIRERLRQERAFGSEDFLQAIEASAGRSPRHRARGRPRASGPEPENNSDLFIQTA
jgi:putative transposase